MLPSFLVPIGYRITFAKQWENLTYQKSYGSVISGMFNGFFERLISGRLGPFSFPFIFGVYLNL
jgi:hypothetical protein